MNKIRYYKFSFIFLCLFLLIISFVSAETGNTWRPKGRLLEILKKRAAIRSTGSKTEKVNEFTLYFKNTVRKYFVHVPPSYQSNVPTPMILHFHGGGGTAEGAMNYSQMNETSDKYGFLAVYPEGTGKTIGSKELGQTWNAGRCCGLAFETKVDDIGFVRALIERLEIDFNVDPKRIYATGLSNGAQMTYRVGCELSDQIAAIATLSSAGVFDQCHPSRPMPVIHFHGTNDPAAFYNGGTCGGAYESFIAKSFGLPQTNKKRVSWSCVPVPEYMKNWAKRNGCSNEQITTFQNGNATCVTNLSCLGNSTVTLCTIKGMGHTWPGGTYGKVCERSRSKMCQSYQEAVGPLNTDISANEEMWKFFKEHPLPD